jgi:hypothetical protein
MTRHEGTLPAGCFAGVCGKDCLFQPALGLMRQKGRFFLSLLSTKKPFRLLPKGCRPGANANAIANANAVANAVAVAVANGF